VFSLVILFSMLGVVIFYLLFIRPRRERSSDDSDVIEPDAQMFANRNGRYPIHVNQYLNTDITDERKQLEEIRLSRLQLVRSILRDYTLDVSACLFQEDKQYDEEVGSEYVLYVPKPGVGNGKDKDSRNNNRRRIPNECVICIEPLTDSSSNRLVWSSNKDCQHCFHEECILNWLNRKTKFPNSRCPCCRADFVSL